MRLDITAHGGDVQLVGLTVTAASNGGTARAGDAAAADGQHGASKRKNIVSAAGAIDPIPAAALRRVVAGLEVEGSSSSSSPASGNDAAGQLQSPSRATLFPADLAVPASLEDAVAGLKEFNLDQKVAAAKEKAKETAATHPKVPEHMRAALALFVAQGSTADGGADAEADKAVYQLANEALQSLDPSTLQPWRDFLWLVLHAWKLVRPEPETVVFRGCSTALADLNLDYSGAAGNGAVLCWAGASPVATSMNVLRQALATSTPDNAGAGMDADGNASPKPRTIVALQLAGSGSSQGRDLSYFGGYSSDRIRPPIVFLPPGVSFTVKSVTVLGNGVAMVRCIESSGGSEPGGGASAILDTTFAADNGLPGGRSTPATGPLVPLPGQVAPPSAEPSESAAPPAPAAATSAAAYFGSGSANAEERALHYLPSSSDDEEEEEDGLEDEYWSEDDDVSSGYSEE